MQQKPIDRYPKLQARYKVLEQQIEAHINLGEKMLKADGGNVYTADLVMVAVLKRSLDLLDGIICLTDRWNFTSAAPLLRLQIDSLLKLVYLAYVGYADTVSIAILDEGILDERKSFRKLKDSRGKLLTDARLRDYARPFYPWLDRVYEETSKLIHLSGKHLSSTVQSVDGKTRTSEIFVGTGSRNWLESEIDNFLDAFGCTTDALLKVVLGWVISKDRAIKADAEAETADRNSP